MGRDAPLCIFIVAGRDIRLRRWRSKLTGVEMEVRIVFEPHEDLEGRTKRTVREVCRWVLSVQIPDAEIKQE